MNVKLPAGDSLKETQDGVKGPAHLPSTALWLGESIHSSPVPEKSLKKISDRRVNSEQEAGQDVPFQCSCRGQPSPAGAVRQGSSYEEKTVLLTPWISTTCSSSFLGAFASTRGMAVFSSELHI